MNLAEATALLAQREELKSKVTNEILQFAEWKEKGFQGLVSFTVFQVDGFHSDAKYSFSYSIDESDTFKSQNTSNLQLNDKVEVFVKDKTGFTDVNCTVTLGAVDEEIVSKEDEKELGEGVVPDAPSSVYFGRFYFQGIPDSGELRDVLEAKTDGKRLTGSDPVFHLKISYDDFETAIRSKELEIEQIETEISEVRKQIREVQKGGSSTTATTATTKTTAKKSTTRKSTGSEKKKPKKKTSTSQDDLELPELEPLDPPTPWGEFIVEKGLEAWDFALNNRAYFLFGVASVGIYLYGDYASV